MHIDTDSAITGRMMGCLSFFFGKIPIWPLASCTLCTSEWKWNIFLMVALMVNVTFFSEVVKLTEVISFNIPEIFDAVACELLLMCGHVCPVRLD